MKNHESAELKALHREMWEPLLTHKFSFQQNTVAAKMRDHFRPRVKEEHEALKHIFMLCGDPEEEGYLDELLLTLSGFYYRRTRAQSLFVMKTVVSNLKADPEYAQNLFGTHPEMRPYFYSASGYHPDEVFGKKRRLRS